LNGINKFYNYYNFYIYNRINIKMLDRNIVILALLVGIIGVPLSYLAMRIEKDEVNLTLISWVRIFFTFLVATILAKLALDYMHSKQIV
jgi:hypothetical protein